MFKIKITVCLFHFMNFRWASSRERIIINMTLWTLVFFHESNGITEFTKQTVILNRKSIISKYRFMLEKFQKVICSKSVLFLLENACQIKIYDWNRLNLIFRIAGNLIVSYHLDVCLWQSILSQQFLKSSRILQFSRYRTWRYAKSSKICWFQILPPYDQVARRARCPNTPDATPAAIKIFIFYLFLILIKSVYDNLRRIVIRSSLSDIRLIPDRPEGEVFEGMTQI